MSESETIAAQIAERWLARTVDSYPESARFRFISEADPFRNPVGHALKENLGILAREVLGEMDQRAIKPALDMLVRLRAVQDFTASDALQFIPDLKDTIAEVLGAIPAQLERRIEELARMASDKYSMCRRQIAALRAKEHRFRAQREEQEQVLR
jgi:hypothetical protein